MADDIMTLFLLLCTIALAVLLWSEMRRPKPVTWVTDEDQAKDMLDAMVGRKEP